ncbi:MAG TPA: SMP-30/gluconolactonase/LRE family protein [Chloroflexota bacterium]|nr:SMP-30/gluconolactonase/LRE family protein [Chloroflexota bacterium]
MEPELIADYQCQTGEGPTWHPLEKCVYWVDIPQCRLFRYDPATNHHEMVFEGPKGDALGGFTVQEDGALLFFMNRGAIKLWRQGRLTTVIEEIADERDGRFNDVIADPAGRVFCGTMSTKDHPGRLYRLDTDGTITKILDGIGTSNGMGFTQDRKQMFYTDTPKRHIYVFDYDQSTGAITNQRVHIETPEDKDEGRPDGMTVDAEGGIWGARWGGSCLVRYSPEGTEVGRIRFPAKKVSSACFGGEDYSDIYVTTAGGNTKDEDGPGAGALFRVRADVRGVPEFFSHVKA